MTSLLSLQHNSSRKVNHSLRTIPIAIDIKTTQPDILDHNDIKTQRRSVAVKRPLANRLAYVDALVDANALVIESIWMSATPHYTTKAAVVPLRTFIQEVLKRSRTTYSTLQTALFYLSRSRPEIVSHLQRMQSASFSNCEKWEDAYISCGRRMFLASLVLASKFVQDKTYRNSAWAKIAGLPVAEVNAAERIFLELIGYKLYISQPMFEQWHHLLHMHVEKKTQNQPTNLLDLACLPFASTTTLPQTQKQPEQQQQQQQQQKHYHHHSRSAQTPQSSSSGWTVVLSPTTFLPPQLMSLKKQDCECQSDTVGRKRRHQEYLMPSPPLSCNSSSPAHPPPVLSTSLPSSSSSSPMHTPTQISPVRVNHNSSIHQQQQQQQQHHHHQQHHQHHHQWKLLSSPASFDHNRTHYLCEESAFKKRRTTLEDSYGYNISHVRQSKRKQSNP